MGNDPDPLKDIDLLDTVRPTGVLFGLLVLGAAWLLVGLLRSALARLGDRFTDRRLLFQQISTLASFVVYLGALGAAFALAVHLSRDVVLALTGTAAVTIGLALKDLASSVLAGLIIIIDRPFQVGDRVNFGGVYGEVTAIGLRSVRLTTLDDNVVTIPNNKFLTDLSSSGNWGALAMMIQMDFFVGADQDVAIAKRLVEGALVANRFVYLKKPWVVLVHQVLHAEMVVIRLRAKAYVLDVKYEEAFQTDLSERVLEAFRLHDIAPPAVLHRTFEASGKSSLDSPDPGG